MADSHSASLPARPKGITAFEIRIGLRTGSNQQPGDDWVLPRVLRCLGVDQGPRLLQLAVHPPNDGMGPGGAVAVFAAPSRGKHVSRCQLFVLGIASGQLGLSKECV